MREEVVVVDAASRSACVPVFFRLMLEDQRVFAQPQRLAVDVGVAGGVVELVHELDPIRPVLRPSTCRSRRSRRCRSAGTAASAGLRTRADADAHERPARLGLGVAEADVLAGQELLDRPGDRVVELRVVLLEPLPEVLVAVPLQARDRARPVEARAAVVAGVASGRWMVARTLRVGDLGRGGRWRRGLVAA